MAFIIGSSSNVKATTKKKRKKSSSKSYSRSLPKSSPKPSKDIDYWKKKWSEANARGDEKGKANAHAEAEKIRAKDGYSGGSDGSQRILTEERKNEIRREAAGVGITDDSKIDWNYYTAPDKEQYTKKEYEKYYPSRSRKYASSGNSFYKDMPYSERTTVPRKSEAERQAEKLAELQKKRAIEALKGQKKSTLSALNNEEKSVAPTYNELRRQATSGSMLNAKNLSEYMASRGLTRSGASVQGEISRQAGLQGQMGDIGQQEASTLDNISSRKTLAESQYQTGIKDASLQAQENATKRLLEEQKLAEQRAYEQQKIAEQRKYEEQQGTNQYQQALELRRIDAEIREAQASKDYNRELELYRQREAIQSASDRELAGLKHSYALEEINARQQETEKIDPNTELNAFSAEIQNLINAGSIEDAKSALSANADAIIREYGLSAYNKLVSQINSAENPDFTFSLNN